MMPAMDPKEVGARIAAQRKAKCLTQKQVADSLHITDKAVSKWECGKNFPDLTVLETLASTLDTTPAYLLGLNEDNSAEALSAATEIYLEQRRRWLKELRNRAWLNLVYCILVFAGLTWVGRYLNDKTLYRPPSILITGMFGLFSCLTGSAIWTLRSTGKQLKNSMS
ncbi:MAG: helix-turn-helix transcriptional regulator [Oscillospiraceae bacterium]|nr:helix-turn-helix transcriptional regulator [Oscillospiraceae bacterium]